MADSDSESSSTAGDAMLVIRTESGSTANKLRLTRCYSRRTLLSLSKSDKVACPDGMKSLEEWYGEYESPPSQTTNQNGHAQGTGRHDRATNAHPRGAKGEQWDGKENREKSNPSWTDRGERRERTERIGERSAAGPSSSTPITGSMGDFRLAGAKPYNEGRERRVNTRDGNDALRDRDLREEKEKPWASATSSEKTTGRADPISDRRRTAGEFVKKDGRAAEEGGWRTARESRDREKGLGGPRSGNDRLGDRDRGDRRRQPAWMDDEPMSASPATGSFQTRRLPARDAFSNGEMPAWAADDEDALGGGTLLEVDRRSPETQKSPLPEAKHVDSIQAWKAEMKELERRKKLEEERAIRQEMGLPDLPDSAADPKSSHDIIARLNIASDVAIPAPAPAPKSVFADFLLPTPAGIIDKTLPQAGEEKPRASRFAKIFGGTGASQPQASSIPSAAAISPLPASHPLPPKSANPGVSAPNALTALFAGATGTVASSNASGQAGGGAGPSQADSQSMMRLMEMLHMSSASSAPPSNQPSPQPAPAQGLSPQPYTSQSSQQSHPRKIQRGVSEERVRQNHGNSEMGSEASVPKPHIPQPQHPGYTSSAPSHLDARPQPSAARQPPANQPPHAFAGNSMQGPQSAPSAHNNVPAGSRLANRMSGQPISPQRQPVQQHQHQPASHSQQGPSIAQASDMPTSRRVFAMSPGQQQPQQQPPLTQVSGMASGLVSPPISGLQPNQYLQQGALPHHHHNALRSPLASAPLPPPSFHNNSVSPGLANQQQAQMAAFLAAQLNMGRPQFSPPQHTGPVHHAHHNVPQQQGNNPRNSSGSNNSALLAQGQPQPSMPPGNPYYSMSPPGHPYSPGPPTQHSQQHQPKPQQGPYPGMFSPNQQLPPHFSQPNAQALAQLFAQGSASSPAFSTAGSPNGLLPSHRPTQPSVNQAHQQQMQQNQIDLMALLTGAARR